MTGRQVGRVNQQSKGETHEVSGILQRAAVRAVADKEVEATEEVESGKFRKSRFRHDFSQVPIDRGGLPSVQAKLRIGAAGEQKSPRPPQHLSTKTPSSSVEDRAIQAKGDTAVDRPESSVERRPNRTGLPDNLKAGVENLSGYSLDDVRVHYNSSKPAQLQALAYTQGTEIHVAPGQEKHLPHEAWHVVQQMQGRVKSTMQMKGEQINDDAGLEREADVMGEKAFGRKNIIQTGKGKGITKNLKQKQPVIQTKLIIESGEMKGWYTIENLRSFLDNIAVLINREGLTVSRGPAQIINDKLEYTVHDIKEVIRFMTDKTHKLQFKELESRMKSMKLEYGSEHGDYHFTGKVTAKKAQWTIGKTQALQLMETEINKHLPALLSGSEAKGWTSWYIGKFCDSQIGLTVEGGEDNFTIQLQVNKERNVISYHGYPDQRLLKEGVGKTKSTIG